MSKFYYGSDYQKNRSNPGIVYSSLDSDGTITITLKMFLDENPGLTAEDFNRWKKWSDNNYGNLYRHNRKQGRKHLPLREDLDLLLGSPGDDDWMDAIENRHVLHAAMQTCLTGKQRRRLLSHHFYGLTCAEIATAEGATPQAVSRSIDKARKKLKNFLGGGFDSPSQKAY